MQRMFPFPAQGVVKVAPAVRLTIREGEAMSIESRVQPIVDRFIEELSIALKQAVREQVEDALGVNGVSRGRSAASGARRRGRRSRFDAGKLVPLLSKDGKPLGKLVEESRGT